MAFGRGAENFISHQSMGTKSTIIQSLKSRHPQFPIRVVRKKSGERIHLFLADATPEGNAGR